MKKKIPTCLLAVMFPVITLQAFAAAFIFDFPQIFEGVLIEKMGINVYRVQFLYSLGAFPNLVTNLIASYFLPKLGVGFIAVIFETFAFVGAALTYQAVRINSYSFLCSARIFVGMCYDLCILGVMLSCEKWFRGKILSISLGVDQFLRLSATSLSYYLLPKFLLTSRNLESSAFFCTLVSFIIFMLTALFAVLDIKYEKLLKNEEITPEEKEENQIEKIPNQAKGNDNFGSKVASIVSAVLEKEFTFRHLKYIPVKGWMLLLYTFITPNIYFQLTNTGSDFLSIRFGLSYEDSKNALALVPLIAAIILPFTSALYSKFGLKPLGLLISNILAMGSYIYLAVLPPDSSKASVTAALIMMSLFYGFNYGSVWTCVFLSIPKEASSLFLGLLITLQNAGFSVLPLVTTLLYQSRTVAGYQNWVYFMIALSSVSMLIGVLILIIDLSSGRVLMMPENDPRVLKIQDKMSSDFRDSVFRKPDRGRSKGPKTEYATLAGGTTKSIRTGAQTGGESSLPENDGFTNNFEGNRFDLSPNRPKISKTKTQKLTRRVNPN